MQNNSDQPFRGSVQVNWNEQQLTAIMRYICYMLLVALSGLFCFYLLNSESANVLIGLGTALVGTGSALWLTQHGKPRVASIFLALTLYIIVTGLALKGHGINDIAVVAYPALLISFSLILPRRFQLLLALLIIVAVAWLVFGAMSGLYLPKITRANNLADFVVVTTILLVTAAAVQLLTGNLHRSLLRAQEEIAERVRTEAALHASEERYALASRGANDGLWDWDLINQTIFFSMRWKTMLGYTDAMIGNDPAEWFDRLHPDDLPLLEIQLEAHRQRLIDRLEVEYRIQHKDGCYRWMLCRGLAVWDATGQATRLVGSQTDITDRKRAEARLRYEALHDSLTSLPNRLLFLDRLQQAIQRQQRTEHTTFAVLFIDLDRFKHINDSLGHLIGDQLLVAAAQSLARCLRASDTIARLGGDEFAVLLDPLEHAQDAIMVAERIQQLLMRPFQLGVHEVFISASIGIALNNVVYQQPDDVLRDADTAMYQAKLRGKACYALFDRTMHADALTLLQLDTDLRRALERGELQLYYQPIVALPAKQLVGFEALLRWQHPTRGLLLPGAFLQLAEDTGLITAIGRWSLGEACRQLAAWQAHMPNLPPLSISVNLAPQQLVQPDLVEQVAAVLHETGLAPQQLILELVERSLLHINDVGAIINRLHSLGVRLSLDDFGTGYSSLSYLHQLPIGKLKIDRSFINRLGGDLQHQAIVTAIIAMAQALSMDVVAEGVETVTQYELLQQLGCSYGQGWLFAYPLDEPAATAYLASHFTA
jgi:diguanylate cyclase (GGDEF)-like protein/PAS domain S-box-containing protein